MKSTFYMISLILILLFSSGCGTSIESKNNTLMTSDKQEDNLETLSDQNIDLKESITGKTWKKIIIDLDKFYPTAIQTVKKSYLIDLTFTNNTATAYADCFKLSAKYKITDKEISFSRISYEPAIELAICQQSEDADEAVFQLFSNDFEATEIKDGEITLYSQELEAEIKLQSRE